LVQHANQNYDVTSKTDDSDN